MGSATTEECSQRNTNGFTQVHRPLFYSCLDCGRKFTKRALEIHKQSCSETENCQCGACKLSKTRLLFKEDNILLDTRQSNPKQFKNRSVFIQGHIKHLLKTTFRHIAPRFDKNSKQKYSVTPVKNQHIHEYGGISNSSMINGDKSKDTIPIKVTNKETSIRCDENMNALTVLDNTKHTLTTDNKNPVGLSSLVAFTTNEGSKSPLDIDEKSEDMLMIDEKCDQDPQNSTEVYHNGVLCNRNIYCVICSKHIEWRCFATHVLDHCDKKDNNRLICPLCNDSRSTPTYFLMHFYSHISSHPSDCKDCQCDYDKCLESSSLPLTEHCYAESIEHRCYICLRYKILIQIIRWFSV